MEKIEVLKINRDGFVKALERNQQLRGVTRYPVRFDEGSSPMELLQKIGKKIVSDFRIDEQNVFLYENLLRWVHGDPAMTAQNPYTYEVVPGRLDKGIYISGVTGTGKSLALRVLAIYSNLFQFKVSFSDDKEIDKKRQLTWGSVVADDIVAEFISSISIKKFKEQKILCIDDLGAEQLEAVAMGNRLNVLRSLLVHRGDNPNSITLITSNFPIIHEATKNFYGDRVVSRLQEMCNYYELEGPDRRVQV